MLVGRVLRRVLIAASAATLMATASALAAPPPIKVVNQGKTVTASQGSYCFDGACADSAYPLPVGCGVRAKAKAPITVRSSERLVQVSVRIVKEIRKGVPRYAKWKYMAGGSPSKDWPLKLPGRKRVKLERAIALDIFVVFAEDRGDSNGWAGLATPGCREAGLPKP